MAELTSVTTEEGVRWDTMALRAYGDHGNISPLITANPGIPLTGRIPGGLTFYIPILEEGDSNSIPAELLPPWKR